MNTMDRLSHRASDRLKCPFCGIPTILDEREGLTVEEAMCHRCNEQQEANEKAMEE